MYFSGLSGNYLHGFWIITSISGDSTTIIFNGKYTYNSIEFVDSLPSIPVNFFEVIKGLKIENQDSLSKLNDSAFNFDNISSYVTLNYAYNTFSLQRYGMCYGNITFNKVKGNRSFTIGEGSPNNPIIHPFILSGHFNFTINGIKNYELTDGRFDMVAQWKANLLISWQAIAHHTPIDASRAVVLTISYSAWFRHSCD